MNVQRLIEKYKKLEGVWDAEGAELGSSNFSRRLETTRRIRNRLRR
ncbi:Uncharacterised protein [Streptococcus pneumoniae]|nr:Uncharacterised protein [Streptococcus pneumoniae]